MEKCPSQVPFSRLEHGSVVLAQEGENGPNLPSVEKFHKAILKAVKNISDTL
jgi:hypothetical protein